MPVWVIIAAFNEEPAIASAVSDVIATGHRTGAVDDGSRERTAELAGGAGAIVVRHPFNLWQGAAL